VTRRVRPGMSQLRTTAPVARNVFWLMISSIAWEVFQGLTSRGAAPKGSWPIGIVDLIFLVLLPALSALAFARLFLMLTQSARGTLNVYSALSSPFAWIFWIGLSVGLMGHGMHVAAHAIRQSLPETFLRGEFATKIAFLDMRVGYLLLGLGFFLATIALIVVGQGAGQRIAGLQRGLFILGSLATYGFVIVYLGVGAQQIVAAIIASVVLSAVCLWSLPPSEVTRDPIGAFVVPGTFLAGVALIAWTLVVGGQPTWP
jgi:hypothetical protein